jgi:alkylation response protein AidB-like acyl-CoA dehydrogenase
MTTFVFTPEQQELRRTVRRFLADKSPPEQVRRLMGTRDGYDPDIWLQLAGQLGLVGLTVPEAHGGSGCGPVEQLIVCEEMGRALLCAPYLSTAVLATSALLASADPAAEARLLPGIAAGSLIATLAVPEDEGTWSTSALRTQARVQGGRWLVTGQKNFVLDGASAGLILVAAQAPDGPSLFAVDSAAPGLARRPLRTLDLTRKQAVIDFDEVPARLVGAEGAAPAIVDRAVLLGSVMLAAEQVGGAQRCLEMSVDYAKLRYQFGRPIGSFQAIKHKCADMLLEVESARSAAYYAAWAAADVGSDLPLAASLAQACCSEAYVLAAAENIQIHGGIGFTWEHDAHLYYRRAKSAEAMLGTPAEHRDLAAGHLIDTNPDSPAP